MALWAYAFRTVAATKTAFGLQGVNIDPLIEDCVNQASQMAEQAFGRDVVSRGEITEFHPKEPGLIGTGYYPAAGFSSYGDLVAPLGPSRPALYLNEWPIVSVTNVWEDGGRAYATPLVVNTDYLVSKPAGKLVRLSGSAQGSWLWSWRAVKVLYIAGYQNVAGSITGAEAVPPALLRVFDELARWMIDQRAPGPKNQVGLQSMTDGLGSRSFSGPAYITPSMQSALDAAGAVRATLRGVTGERDS